MPVGRPRKPTALHVLNGNPSKIKNLGKNEPKPAPIAPKCPAWLSKDAKKEWKRVAPELERLGLLTQLDMVALSGYCESWAQYKKAIEFIHDHDDVYPITDAEGNIKYLQQVPQVSMANKAIANVRALCSEFGLTPSARGRIQVPGKEDQVDEMEKMFNKNR